MIDLIIYLRESSLQNRLSPNTKDHSMKFRNKPRWQIIQ